MRLWVEDRDVSWLWWSAKLELMIGKVPGYDAVKEQVCAALRLQEGVNGEYATPKEFNSLFVTSLFGVAGRDVQVSAL
jgi:antibiotic biosynthesis monooxygenase (ABM) superfamily enzyme